MTSADTGRLLLIDPARSRVSRAFLIGGTPASVAVAWATSVGCRFGGTVARVDPVTGRLQMIRVGRTAAGIAYAAAPYGSPTVPAAASPGRPTDSSGKARAGWQRANRSRGGRARPPSDGAAVAGKPPPQDAHGRRAALATRPVRRPGSRMERLPVADPRHDQRWAGRLPPRRRSHRRHTRSRSCYRRCPRRPTAASVTFQLRKGIKYSKGALVRPEELPSRHRAGLHQRPRRRPRVLLLFGSRRRKQLRADASALQPRPGDRDQRAGGRRDLPPHGAQSRSSSGGSPSRRRHRPRRNA